MPFSRPTLSALRTQARADVGSLTRTGALLRFSNLGVLADLVAGAANGLYGYLDRIARNATPFTAVDLEIIAGWAALKGVAQKQPQPAALQATFSGVAGTVIPAGTPVVRLLDGTAYTTAADAAVGAGGAALVTIVATLPGAAGNTVAGATLVLGVAIAGVQSQGVAGAATAAGADLEDPLVFRARMLRAYAQPPQGGSVADYVTWAGGAAGVTRAWVAPQGMGPGTVVVFVMLDSARAAYGGFPQGANGVAAGEGRDAAASGDQLAVANALFARCNVNALVYACAPRPNLVTLTLGGLSAAPAAVKAAIQAAVAAVFLADGSPGGVRLDSGAASGVIPLSDIQAAIQGVAGSAGYLVTGVTASAGAASPTTNITSSFGALPVLAPIVFA